MRQRVRHTALVLLATGLAATPALAQSTVLYRLHAEPSAINNAQQLKTTAPDVAAVVRQSVDLKNSTSNYLLSLGNFETQAAEPGVFGTIPEGAVVTFSVWLRKTAMYGTFHPTAVLKFNQS
jgi:hypothetical protein